MMWKALLVAVSLSAIATIASLPTSVSTNNQVIAQAKQPSSNLLRTLSGHGGIIRAIAISTNGQTLVSGGDDRTINLWDFPAGNITASFTGHSDGVTAVAISPDGKTVVSSSADRTIKLWDTKTQDLRRTLTGHLGVVRTVAISPNGIIASGSDDGTIKLWDLQTGKLIGSITSERKNYQAINYLTISRDGKILASGNGSGKIKLWNLQTRKLIRTLSGHGGEVWSVAISPDGQTIATSSTDYSYLTIPGGDTANIKLWNVKTGKLIRSFSGHFADVRAIAISPNGQIFATGGGYSQDVKLWNLKTGKLLNTLAGHKGGIYSLTFSPDGKTVISGSADSTIKVWQIKT